nr:SDR family oxidoreductase [Amycolatopsis rubida]
MTGKVSLVTGGAKGVGRAISRLLAGRGAHVIVNCFHSDSSAEDTVSEILGLGGSAEAVKASVSGRESVAAMFAGIRERHGGLDLLFNNAARGIGRIGELRDEDWAKAIEVNLHGSRWCAEQAALLMRGRPGAAIVNVSAIGAGWVMPGYAAGGVAKAAVEALTRYLAVDLAPLGIRVNAASASLVDSPTAAKFADGAALSATVAASTPLRRLATENDLAELALFLASDRASFITGQTVLADGGLTLASAALSAPGSPRRAQAYRRDDADASPIAASGAGSDADDPAQAVAVVGAGLAVPGASSPEEFWDLLRRPSAMFTEPGQRFAIENFWAADPDAPDRTYSRVAGYLHGFLPHRRLREEEDEHGVIPDEATRWLRHSILQAGEGIAVDETRRCAVYVGAWPGGSQSLAERIVAESIAAEAARVAPGEAALVREWLLRRYPRGRAGVPALPEEMLDRATAGLGVRLADAMVVDTACSSSLYAVDLGVKALLDSTCDVAYCGGTHALDPTATVMFAKLRGLAPDGRVRSFDTAADGTLFSDGAGVVALKRYADALADGDPVLGILAGFGAAADGKGKSIAAPNPDGQRLTIARARAVNGLGADEVDWVVAHATGTAAGDQAELAALGSLSSGGRLLCSSSKSVVGHTGWAAGTVSLIHGLLALRHERIPAQFGLERAHPDVADGPLDIPAGGCVPFPARPGSPRTVGISAFGFGGTNGHLLVTDRAAAEQGGSARRSAPPVRGGEIVLVGWSAHLPGAPDRASVLAWLRGRPARHSRVFPTPYPPPPPVVVRMPPRTIRAVDPAHLMAREVAARFAEENGELWADVRRSTGVITAYSGVPGALGGAVIRCYAEDVLSGLRGNATGDVSADTVEHALASLRERYPACTEDTQPGVMPNVIGSRITSRYDLNGASITVAAGRDTALAALNTASRYLRTGELDLGLVLALSYQCGALSGRTAETAEPAAEGAFLLALAESGTAERHGWPVLAAVRPTDDATSVRDATVPDWDYLGANAAVELLKACETGAPVDLRPAVPRGTGLRVSPVRRGTVTRYQRALRPTGPVATAAPAPATGEGIALIADNALAGRLSGTILTTDPREVRAGTRLVADLDDPDAMQSLHALLDSAPPRLSVVADFTGTDQASLATPSPALIRLHDLLSLAVRRLASRWDAGGSLAVLLCGHAKTADDGVPLPHAALFTGFVKSLSWERPASPIFAVVTDATGDSALGLLAAERQNPRPEPVVWYLEGRRHTEILTEAPLPASPGHLPLSDASVVLASGGTGGVTIELLDALARHARPRVWLLGRTVLAEQPNLAHTAECTKSDLISRLRRDDSARPLKEIAREASLLMRAREARRALDRLRNTFGTDRVQYLSCDVRDPGAAGAAVETVLRSESTVDVVLHAAGVFRPENADTKPLSRFRAVRDTKLLGYQNLKAAFGSRPPSLWCNIGSAAGTYGVPGDTDYASANDFLAAASRLRAPGTRELTIGFPLWSGTGYGSDPLNRSYLDRQGRFTAVSSREGTRIFLSELASSDSGESCYLGDRERTLFSRARPGYVGPIAAAHSRYLREEAGKSGRETRWRCTFDPDVDRFLDDHRVDGRPAVPGTLMLEIAAQAAEAIRPGLATAGFRDARFERFIRPFSGRRPRTVTIKAVPVGESRVTVVLESDVVAPDGSLIRAGQRHFRADVLLGRPGETSAAPVRAVSPHTSWRPVTDPYYQTNSPVHLRGIFANTSGARVEGKRAWSRWQPDFDGSEFLGAMHTPFLLLCAAARAVALPLRDRDRQAVYVPRAIGRIDLHAPGRNDLGLTSDHATAGIELSTTDLSSCRAVTGTGTTLLELSGLSMEKLGEIPDTASCTGHEQIH